jgi:hypothetical protein
MGLDMYLNGDKYLMNDRKRGDRKSEQYDLGYWRKHPNLHGYIVQTFAEGIDECQAIELSADGIKKIIEAITNRHLPETTGFFFGTSDDSKDQIAYDVEIFEDALKWLETEEPDVWRSVSYRASW